MKLIDAHPSTLLADQYAALVANRCQIDPAKLRPRRRATRPSSVPTPKAPALKGPEFEAIRLMIAQRDEVGAWLIPRLLTNSLALRLLAALRADCSIAEIVASAEPDIGPVIAQMSLEGATGDPSELRTQLTTSAATRAVSALAAPTPSQRRSGSTSSRSRHGCEQQ